MTDEAELELRRQAERRADAKLGFRSHLVAYVVINAGLMALNLLTSPDYLWFYWALIGWGFGLAAHAISVFAMTGDHRERAVQAELKRLRETRSRP